MGKDAPLSSSGAPKAHKKSSIKDPHGGTNDIIRGQSHASLLQKRKHLKTTLLPSLTPTQRQNVLAHYHGSAGRNDLSTQRLQNLKQDDAKPNNDKLTPHQQRAITKRKSKPNMGLQRQMHRRETKRLENAIAASDAQDILHAHTPGMVEPETDMEKTVQLSQVALKHSHLEEMNARNIYDLDMPDHAPYLLNYDRSGKWAIMAGKKRGHVSIVDQHSMALKTEFYVNETVRDACFLHNGSMVAVAQEKNVYVYDDEGVEIHRMDQHRRVLGMEFLPYHWLLGELL